METKEKLAPMLSILKSLFQSTQAIWGIITAFGAMLMVWFIRKEAKSEVRNEILEENIKNVEQQAQKVIENQQKQAEIASKPTPSRDGIHDGLCEPD